MRRIVMLTLALAAGIALAEEPLPTGKTQAPVRTPAKAATPVRAPAAAEKAKGAKAICTEDCGQPAADPARKVANPPAPARR